MTSGKVATVMAGSRTSNYGFSGNFRQKFPIDFEGPCIASYSSHSLLVRRRRRLLHAKLLYSTIALAPLLFAPCRACCHASDVQYIHTVREETSYSVSHGHSKTTLPVLAAASRLKHTVSPAAAAG